jgi:hypothetical protein
MSEDYLWDRSGPADREIDELERALTPLRYRHRPERVKSTGPRFLLAAAAAAVVVALALWQFTVRPVAETGWRVASLEGIASVTPEMQVRTGQWIRTGEASQITLESGSLGRVEIGPKSELRAQSDRRLSLALGTLHAFIWAPAREFVLETPSARAIDLGCEYTISVAPSGDGLLRVQTGWVAFAVKGKESFIPAGAECVTRKKDGPGIPYFSDAEPPFREGLAKFESGDISGVEQALRSARPRDGLTLWHLLTRVPEGERPAVFDRFAVLVPLPVEVARAKVLRCDPQAIDLCWNALHLENTEWWRGWEREWK